MPFPASKNSTSTGPLYVQNDGPDREKSLICHAQGSAGRFRFEETLRYARTYETICGLESLGKIRAADAGRLKDVCAAVPVQNETQGWNCQDWVHDAFVVLVDGGILCLLTGSMAIRSGRRWKV
ncbi:hypothetical protein F503_01606 [Ophiostoma piceae UAMH 11346]|uniref:Uncharacterized protein n=1 Tax=Ophiostoma piceae (strain UAMH 11346) TaxID=1262450 RepID=S3CQF9_OPHP1|nr:hypothetical protein F503_01606 [Ophiostoma piceae UAMH 11346]